MRAACSRGQIVLFAVLAVLGCLAAAAGSAFASKGVVGVFGSSGSGDGQFANASATALNLTTGEVYVVDQFQHRVERFDAAGGFLGAFGWGVADGNAAAETCSSGCQVGLQGSGDGQFDTPQGVAVDQSDGSVYVVDGNNNRVEKFNASGTYISQFGSAGSAEGQFSGPQGIAVDPGDGSVYVADAGNNRVEKFDNTGTFVRTFGFGVADGNSAFETCTSSCQPGLAVGDGGGLNFPTRVAVDSTGQVYVLDSGNGRIERYTATGAFDQVFDPTDVNGGTSPLEIAVGPGNDHLYVAQAAPDFSEQRVFEIDASGTLIDIHGAGAGVFNASGLALNAGSQKIYLADGFAARVLILDDVTLPDVTIDPASDVTSTSASLSGTVNPNGNPDVGWHFEISTDDASWNPTADDQDPGSGTSPVPVSQNLTGLIPNTTYFVRLVAKRALNAPAISNEIQFTTIALAPDVVTEPADDLAPTHATFKGTLNAHHSPTAYFFEYGTTTSYGQRAPATDADGGAETFITAAIQRVNGLSPGTTYHYRLVATNQSTTVRGQDQTFTTPTPPPDSTTREGIPGAGFLPDDRGWELVSPPDKNGSDILADTGRTRAAADGNAASFASLGAFGDAQGGAVAVEYMALRDGRLGTPGWSTHAITPKQDTLAYQWAVAGFRGHYEGEFSPDLSRGVLRTSSPVTNDPAVAKVGNLYRRTDLRTPGVGSYDLLTACPACGSTPLTPIPPGTNQAGQPWTAGASADFGHVVFESAFKLTPDATANGTRNSKVNLYEWDHGVVRLVGILPDGTPAPASQAGPGAGNTIYMPRVISADGSRIFFTVYSGGQGTSGRLYMRVNHSSTVQINATERTDCADQDPCSGELEPDPSGPQPARFWNVGADGSRAFFTSSERLTDDAQGGGANLYMYDTTAAAGHHLRFLVGGVQGVIGISDDGHYAYLVATDQAVEGQPFTGHPGLFLWHDGHLSYIGALADAAKDMGLNLPSGWGFLSRTAARVTPDGRHLLFTSGTGTDLAGYDHGNCGDTDNPRGCEELYLYSADAHRLSCASCNPSGTPGIADAVDNLRVNVSAAGTTWHVNRAVSADGRHVFFSTAEALDRHDSNGRQDVYEYDAATGTMRLISSGEDSSDSYFMDASASGDDVFFLTRQQLVGWDNDQNYDLYDARVGGGLPDPSKPSAECSGDVCRGALSGTPGLALPGSTQPTGSGNLKRTAKRKPVRCKRGFMRKKVKSRKVKGKGKVRCVKKRHTRRTSRHARRRNK
jgi:DNA-binding beta-propeller fold protein YncE